MTSPADARLAEDQTFPSLTLTLAGGGTLTLPGDLAGSPAVVLVYRGSWCPFCTSQLAAFARATAKLTEAGARVVAISADTRADAEAMAAELRLPFPVACEVDPDKLAGLIGNYVGADMPRRYAQTTNVLLDPDGKVMIAVYSNGPIGRLTPSDVLGYLAYLHGDSEGH
jgi:peroxiredoxin